MQQQTRSIICDDLHESERSSLSAPIRTERDVADAPGSKEDVVLKQKLLVFKGNDVGDHRLSRSNDDQKACASLAKLSTKPSSVSIAYRQAKFQPKGALVPGEEPSGQMSSQNQVSSIAGTSTAQSENFNLVGVTRDDLTRIDDTVTPGAVAVGGFNVSNGAFSQIDDESDGPYREDITIVAEVVAPHEDVEDQVRHITDEVLNRLRDNLVDAEKIEKVDRPDEGTASKRRQLFLVLGCLTCAVVVAVVIAVVVRVATRKQSSPSPPRTTPGLAPSLQFRPVTFAPSQLLVRGSGNNATNGAVITNGTVITNATIWETCRQGFDTCAKFWTCCVAPADAGTNKTTCRPPGGSSCVVNVIANWATCKPGADLCANNWFCCVATADFSTGKSTCRPGGTACAGNLIPNWSTCRKGLDYCGNNDICRVAPADISSGKTTCRPL